MQSSARALDYGFGGQEFDSSRARHVSLEKVQVLQILANSKAKEVEEILLPGEVEKNIKKQRLSKGIPLDDQTIKDLIDTANFVGMKNVDENFMKGLLA